MSDPQLPMWQRWAQFRFSVIGELLSCPPPTGQLQQAINQLAKKLPSPHRFQPANQLRAVDHRTMVLQSQDRFGSDRRVGSQNSFGRGCKVGRPGHYCKR